MISLIVTTLYRDMSTVKSENNSDEAMNFLVCALSLIYFIYK